MPSRPRSFPVELGSVPASDALVGRLHRLAMAGGPGWGLAKLLRRAVQVDGENSAGQTGLFLSALLGHSSAVQLLLAFGANPNHRCLDGSTPVHAGAFSGRSLVLLHLLQAGGDLRLHDQQGRTPRDWAERGGARQCQEVLELMQLCRAYISTLVNGSELAHPVTLGALQASSGHSLCGSLSSLWQVQADRTLRPEHMRRSPQVPALGFGQLSHLQPLGLVTGIPLVDPKELLPAQGEPDRIYESSSQTIMANLLWRGHPVTVRQLKASATQPDVLLADLQQCSSLHHSNLLLLMALCPSADLSQLGLVFEPVWLGSLHGVLHPQGQSKEGPQTVPCLLPGHLLLQVLEALLFLQARGRVHGGLSSHAVQLVRPGLVKVSGLEHGRDLPQHWLRPRSQQGYPLGGPGPGLPPPPELYPWLPLELIHSDMPTITSDLYSFCILAQEVFTGELPWAGRAGPEVKAKLEAGEGPALDPLVPVPYQALIQAGLGLSPAERGGSLQSTRYLLREAVAQVSAPKVTSPVKQTILSPAPLDLSPDKLYYEVACRTKATTRHELPVTPPGPILSQALETLVGHSRSWRGEAWGSGSSLALCSSPSPSLPAKAGLHCCLELDSTVWTSQGPGAALREYLPLSQSVPGATLPATSPAHPHSVASRWQLSCLFHQALSTERSRETEFGSLQSMDLLQEIMVELQSGSQKVDVNSGTSPALAPQCRILGCPQPLFSADPTPAGASQE